MSEKFGQHFHSAEKKLTIEAESGYFAAQKFTHNPIEYLTNFRIDLLESEADEGDIAIQAIERIIELCDVIRNENVPVRSSTTDPILETTELSQEWGQHVFSLLKTAGYSKSGIKTWLLLEEPFTALGTEFNASRKLNKILDETYAE